MLSCLYVQQPAKIKRRPYKRFVGYVFPLKRMAFCSGHQFCQSTTFSGAVEQIILYTDPQTLKLMETSFV